MSEKEAGGMEFADVYRDSREWLKEQAAWHKSVFPLDEEFQTEAISRLNASIEQVMRLACTAESLLSRQQPEIVGQEEVVKLAHQENLTTLSDIVDLAFEFAHQSCAILQRIEHLILSYKGPGSGLSAHYLSLPQNREERLQFLRELMESQGGESDPTHHQNNFLEVLIFAREPEQPVHKRL